MRSLISIDFPAPRTSAHSCCSVYPGFGSMYRLFHTESAHVVSAVSVP